MSYTPHTWVVGDVITAARLNALEEGVANAGNSYDAVIKASLDEHDSVYTLESGSLANVVSKLQNEEFVQIVIYSFDNYNGNEVMHIAHVPTISQYDNGILIDPSNYDTLIWTSEGIVVYSNSSGFDPNAT